MTSDIPIRLNGRPRFYYGWVIVAASFIMLFFNSASQFTIGVLFTPIADELAWKRADVSLAVMINMAVFAISMFFMGRAFDRIGPKWVILGSSLSLGIGYFGSSNVSSLYQFIIFYGFFCGIGFAGCTILVVTSLIAKWFIKWRGTAISVALAGGCLGQFVLIPLYTRLEIMQGWRTTYLLLGVITIVINFSLALFLVKERSDQQKDIDHDRQDHTVTSPATFVKFDTEIGVSSLRESLGTTSFWLFAGIMFVCGAGDFFVTTHFIPFVRDAGISQKSAGNMMAVYGLFSLFGILAAGIAADFIGSKLPILITFLTRAVLFILLIFFQNEVMFYIFSIGFGFTMLITAVLTVTLLSSMFGMTNIGTLSGLITTIHHLGGGFLIYTGGILYDQSGSYHSVFVAYLLLSLMSAVVCLFINEKRRGTSVTKSLQKMPP